MTDHRETVLNRWATGEGAGMIARDFGCNPSSVRSLVRRARNTGDKRAVSHADAVAGTDTWRARFAMRHQGGRIAGWVFVGTAEP